MSVGIENSPIVLTAQWRHLVMLNYSVDPELLSNRIPAGTELDFWQGRTYLSVVAFRFLKTRLYRWSIPCHRHFSEINLRFYVRHRHHNEWRRGVVFIKEIVSLPAVTLMARRLYNENYITLPMRFQRGQTGSPDSATVELKYSWRWQGRWNQISARTRGLPEDLEPGSEEEFITEHYWGYTRQRDGSTLEYQVEHPRWKTWKPDTATLDCDVETLYGREFARVLLQPATSVLVADGSEITVRKGNRIR